MQPKHAAVLFAPFCFEHRDMFQAGKNRPSDDEFQADHTMTHLHSPA